MNEYEFKELSEAEFDSFAGKHPGNSIFQTVAWSKLKSNWDHYYVGVSEDKELTAAAMILVRNIRFGFRFAYIPRGPLVDFDNGKLTGFFFSNLKVFLKGKSVVLAKFDPNIKIASLDFEEKDKLPAAEDSELVDKIAGKGISHCGYVLSIHDSIQPRIQLGFVIDDDIDGRIGRKTMKKVRASYKKGVTLKHENNADNLADIISFTESRHHINLRNKEYFNDILRHFGDNATVLTAYAEDTPISSCLLVKSRDTAEILYSGYNDDYKKYNSTYPMRYEAILWGRDNGCKVFNFGGAEGTLDDGLTMFKSAFRPNIDAFIGEFDMVVVPVLGNLASFGLKVR